jgi:hypothetical protein
LLRNGYGYGTLSVNGKYLDLTGAGGAKLSRHFAIAAKNEEGEFIPSLAWKGDYVMTKLRRLLGLRS